MADVRATGPVHLYQWLLRPWVCGAVTVSDLRNRLDYDDEIWAKAERSEIEYPKRDKTPNKTQTTHNPHSITLTLFNYAALDAQGA